MTKIRVKDQNDLFSLIMKKCSRCKAKLGTDNLKYCTKCTKNMEAAKVKEKTFGDRPCEACKGSMKNPYPNQKKCQPCSDEHTRQRKADYAKKAKKKTLARRVNKSKSIDRERRIADYAKKAKKREDKKTLDGRVNESKSIDIFVGTVHPFYLSRNYEGAAPNVKLPNPESEQVC